MSEPATYGPGPLTVAHAVSWTVQRRNGWRGLLARAAEIAAAIVNFRTAGWHLSPIDAKLPVDMSDPLSLDLPLVHGRAPFMPRYVDDPGLAMEVYLDRATVMVPHGFQTAEVVVPLAEYVIAGSRCLSSRWFPKGPTARWELTLTSEKNAEPITVLGTWLTLAWLGHLGGWREPIRL